MKVNDIEQALMAISAILPCERSSIWVVRGDVLVPLKLQQVAADVEREIALPLTHSCSGLADSCAVFKEFYIVNKTAQELKVHSDLEKLLKYYVASSLVVPVLQNNNCIGVIQCLNKENGFTYNDYLTVSAIAEKSGAYFSSSLPLCESLNCEPRNLANIQDFAEYCIPILARLWNRFKTFGSILSFDNTHKDREVFYSEFFEPKADKIKNDSTLIEEAANSLRTNNPDNQEVRELCHQVIAALTPVSFALRVDKVFKHEIKKEDGVYVNQIQRSNEELSDRFESVIKNIARIYKLLRPVLSRDTKVNMCDFKRFLENSYSEFFVTYRDGVPIKFTVQDKTGGAEIFLDSEKITEAIEAVLINAAEALRDSDTTEKPCVELCFYDYDGSIIFAVADNVTGGIPDEVRDKVFDKNFTTKEYGNGIGLAASKAIVESLGGSISFKTSEKGTVFLIEVPKKGAENEDSNHRR